MLFRNTELDRAFAFIAQSDFDIFCLQEVPEKFLKRLETLPCFMVLRRDVERLFASGAEHNFVVILSRYPLTAQGEVPFRDYWPLLPLRTRLFIRLMRPFGFSRTRNRGAIFADVRIPNMPTTTRIFNLHLILAHPRWRSEEFELALAKRTAGQPIIVCGDFNILEAPHITLLNWFLGGRVRDAVLYRRERTHIEKRFATHELINAFHGETTHPFSRSQLDHILVSSSFSIKNAMVLPDRIGSDHHPIRIDLT